MQLHGDNIALVHYAHLQGCEFSVQTPQGSVAAHFILRFGVLLAADPTAHALLSSIPVAPTSVLVALSS